MSFYVIPQSGEMIYDMSFDKYKSLDRVNQSYLKKLVEKSPKHAEHQKANPSKPTPAMETGTLWHSVLFGEIDLESTTVFSGRRQGAAWDATLKHAEESGCSVLTSKEYNAAKEALESVPEWLRKEISESKCEVTILFDLMVLDSELTIPCKARIDILGNGVIRDYKTTSKGVGERAFQRQIGDFFYDMQAAFYQKAVFAATGETLPYQWLAQETVAPNDVAGYTASEENIANGNSWLNESIRAYVECLKTGEFKGVWNGSFSEIDSPDWHLYEPKLDTTGVKEVSTL